MDNGYSWAGSLLSADFGNHQERPVSNNPSYRGNVVPTTPDFNRPILKRMVTLQSYQAQSVFDYAFEDVERALYVLSALMGMGAPDLAEAAGSAATQLMDELRASVKSDMERMEKLLDDNGITELASFRRPAARDADITSPRANGYLDIIMMFDKLATMVLTLWLMGVLNDQQKENALRSMSRMLAGARAKFSVLSYRAYMGWVRRSRDRKSGVASKSIASESASTNENAPRKRRGAKPADDLALGDDGQAVSEEDAVAALASASGREYKPRVFKEEENDAVAEHAVVEEVVA